MAKKPWYSIFKADPSPDNQMFKGLKAVWSDVDTSSADFVKIELGDEELRVSLLEFYSNLVQEEYKKRTLRGDYLEVVEISIMMLGGSLPGGKEFKWKKPGATHKARFLAWGLCALKLLAFSQVQVVKDQCFSEKKKQKKETVFIFDPVEVEKLNLFCNYAITFYLPMFLEASIGADGAYNDLHLWKRLHKFREQNEKIANRALETLNAHLWSLAPNTVMFSLFSDKVSLNHYMQMSYDSKLYFIVR